MALTVSVDNADKVERALSALTKNRVMVGIPADTTDRTGGGISNAALGYIHEFGAPSRNIPARPFLIPGVRAAQGEVTAALRKGAQDAFNGDPQAGEKALNAAGLVASTSVKKQITDGTFAPLKPTTLAARARRGHSGTSPLIDTGQLLRSVTYVIRPK